MHVPLGITAAMEHFRTDGKVCTSAAEADKYL